MDQEGTGEQQAIPQPGFRQLNAWQRSDDLAFEVWKLSRKIPREDGWLTNQLRRAASSAPANIAEGYSRLSLREYLHHLSIARASLAETEYWLHFAHRLGHLTNKDLEPLSSVMRDAGNLLYGLIRALARRMASDGTKTNTYLIREEEADYRRDELNDPDLSNLDSDIVLDP